MATAKTRHRFTRSMRLSLRREFNAIFAARMSHADGPLVCYTRPNARSHPRLGLTVSRRVGRAVLRNRVKRRLREAFRLIQHEIPSGYDVVIVVRPHEPLHRNEYADRLMTAIEALHERWLRQENKP